MASTRRLAKAIVAMADSRTEVVRRDIEKESEIVDYYIQLKARDGCPGDSHYVYRMLNLPRSIFVKMAYRVATKAVRTVMQEIRQRGIDLVTPQETREINIVDWLWFALLPQALNATAVHGYEPCPGMHDDAPVLCLRVTRELLKAHPEVI